MKPEFRTQIDVNLKRKIEAIVRRKTASNEEIEDTVSKCPICGLMIGDYQLECPTTRDALPMCVVTGKHMVLDDWTFCPVSKAPALFSEYKRYITTYNNIDISSGSNDTEPTPNTSPERKERKMNGTAAVSLPLDPVLGKPVNTEDIVKVTPEEAMKYIKRYNNVAEEKKKTKVNENGEEVAVDGDGEDNGAENDDRKVNSGSTSSPSGSKKTGEKQKSPSFKGGIPNPRFRTKKINIGK